MIFGGAFGTVIQNAVNADVPTEVEEPEDNGLLEGLLAYFPMNEESGDMVDVSETYTLVAQNAPGSAAGKIYDLARLFARESEQYFTASIPDIENLNTAMTFAWWEYPVSYTGVGGNYNYIWGQGSYASGGFHIIHTHDGGIVLYLHDNTGPEAEWSKHTLQTPTLNAWNFSIFTYDSNTNVWTYRLNAEDELTDSDWVTGAWKATTSDPTVGCGPNLTHHYDGRMGPIMIWNSVLTSDQRLALYNSGAGIAYEDFT